MFLDGISDISPLLSYYRIAPGSFEENLPFHATNDHAQLVSGSLHSSSEVLFNFRSPYIVRYRSGGVFRLGSSWLPSSRGISNPRYSGISAQRRPRYVYGAITLYGSSFQMNLTSEGGRRLSPKHYIPASFHRRVQFGLFPVRSPLLRESHLDFFSCGY